MLTLYTFLSLLSLSLLAVAAWVAWVLLRRPERLPPYTAWSNAIIVDENPAYKPITNDGSPDEMNRMALEYHARRMAEIDAEKATESDMSTRKAAANKE
jgi:hypothetical protein